MNPANIKSTPRSSPRKNDQVTPKRLRPLVRPGMNAPRAIRMVAGTRELSLPANSAATAPGSDPTKFTLTARIAQPAGNTGGLGMYTDREQRAPSTSATAPAVV